MKVCLLAAMAAGVLAWGGMAAAAVPSARSGMGAVPYADAKGTGTTFRVWAGAAKQVEVAGEFNGWGRTAMADEGNGIWSIDVPGAGHGQQYKFILDGSKWRQDPRSVRVVSSATNANSIIYDHSLFDWGGAERVVGGTEGSGCIWRNDLVIYEMHVGSFNAESGVPATFDEAIGKIPHLRRLGVSAVELMPVAEFAGDKSWGYNPSVLFAPESSYGGADGLKRFVKACHEAGLAVMVDVVHNHYGPGDLGIWQFDGTGPNGGMYFYDDDRRVTDWGETRPDYGNTNVAAFIRDQVFSLVEDYHIDGFRWDSVFNIAYVGGTWNQEGADLLTSINAELYAQHPDVFRIAEDNALTTWEEAWMGFEAQWHHGFLNYVRDLATAPDDEDRDLGALASWLNQSGGFYQVAYAESHDSCGNLNGKHRLPRDIDGDSPQGYWAKKRAFLANAVALTAPAIPMIFMGTEYNEDWDFSNDHSLRWSGLAEENDGIVSMYADLIGLRRNSKGVSGSMKEINATTTTLSREGKILAVARGTNLLEIFNWSAQAKEPYPAITFPAAGEWHCLFNSDWKGYDEAFGGVGAAVNETLTVGASRSAEVALGAYSLQIWGTSPLPVEKESAVATEPEWPAEGETVALRYEVNDGPLAGRAEGAGVVAHVGFNGWHGARDIPMRNVTNEVWSCEVELPAGTWSLSVCFHDGNGLWDNHGGENWVIPVTIADETPVPDFAVTEPAAGSGPVDVGGTDSLVAAGTSENFAGGLLWSNAANGAWGTLRPGAEWSAGPIPLEVGTNELVFAALNPNDGARDEDYGAFGDGVNGGNGFAPWRVETPAEHGGVFTDSKAGWGMWANSGATVEARRPFAHPLQEGDTVRFGFRNGDIGKGGDVGFALCNGLGQAVLEYRFDGGARGYTLSAADTIGNAAPWTAAVQRVEFTLGADWTFQLAVGGTVWGGKLRHTSVDRVAAVRFWNHSAGDGGGCNVYASGLSAEGANPFLEPRLERRLVVVRDGGAGAECEAVAASVAVGADGVAVLSATLKEEVPGDLAGAVWWAEEVDAATGGWKWMPMADGDVTVEGRTVSVRCRDAPVAVISFGLPGGGGEKP